MTRTMSKMKRIGMKSKRKFLVKKRIALIKKQDKSKDRMTPAMRNLMKTSTKSKSMIFQRKIW